MKNLNQYNSNKLGCIELNNGYLQYSVLENIVTVVYFFNNNKNVGIVSFDKKKIENINSTKSILSAIEVTNLPIYILSKDSVLNFVSDNSIYLPENIRDEVIDVLDDFNALSYKDFINTIYEDIEYSSEVNKWLRNVILEMQQKNIQPYNVNYIILETFKIFEKII